MPCVAKSASRHAINRFRQRTKSKKSSESIQAKMLNMVERGVEVKLKDEYRLRQLLKHKCTDAKYINFYGWVLVVVNDVIVTVHENESGRWTTI